MKRAIAIVITLTIIAVVVVSTLAMGMTRYVATFTWEAEVGRGLIYDIDSLEPTNITYSKTTFWDYFLPAKGHSGIIYSEGFVEVWVNVTDSSNTTRSGYNAVNWNASDPDTYDDIVVKVLGLKGGPAQVLMTFHFYNEVTEFMNYHLWRMYDMEIEVG